MKQISIIILFLSFLSLNSALAKGFGKNDIVKLPNNKMEHMVQVLMTLWHRVVFLVDVAKRNSLNLCVKML